MVKPRVSFWCDKLINIAIDVDWVMRVAINNIR